MNGQYFIDFARREAPSQTRIFQNSSGRADVWVNYDALTEIVKVIQTAASEDKGTMTASDALTAQNTLQIFIDAMKRPLRPEELRSSMAVFNDFLKVMNKLNDTYYAAKIEQTSHAQRLTKSMLAEAQLRHEYLFQQMKSDPTAIGILVEEFYPEKTTAPDNPDLKAFGPNVTSMTQFKNNTQLRATFKQTVFGIVQAGHPISDLGTPRCIQDLMNQYNLIGFNLKSFERTQNALSVFAGDLRSLIKNAPDMPMAQIHILQARTEALEFD